MKSGIIFLVGLILIVATSIACTNSSAANPKTIEFKVTGNCSMCKKTIESSLKDVKGIEEGTWDVKSKMVKVTFDPAHISEQGIHNRIAGVGYDTEKVKAADEVYSSLPNCCQYERTLHK